MCTVVYNLRGAHTCSALQVIYAHTVATTGNIARINAITAQRIYGALAYLVLGQLGYEVSLMPVVGKTYGHVGLASAVNHVEHVALYKPLLSGRRQAEHYLAQCYYFCHFLMF